MTKFTPGDKCIVMTRDEVRAFDAYAINELGIPGVVLMENAGRSCAELIEEKLSGIDKPKVCIFCGTGNNGGDGYVIARHLLNSGFEVRVIICGERERIKGDAKTNLNILERMGQTIEQLALKQGGVGEKVKEFVAGANMVVDAIFGTGLSGRLRDEYIQLIEGINGLACLIFAVDIPSGLDCDSGQPLGAAVRACCTVTFVAVKKGFTIADSTQYTGDIYVASIGVEPE